MALIVWPYASISSVYSYQSRLNGVVLN